MKKRSEDSVSTAQRQRISVIVRTVGIISAGDMGAAIGNTLNHGGLRVITPLDGRSSLTKARADESFIEDVGSVVELVRQADLVLSVLVPTEARIIATEVADAMRVSGTTPPFVECNAIAPKTVVSISGIIENEGAVFIDAGIIGAPPKPGSSRTRFHCSGPDTSALEALTANGLDVRYIGPTIGQASGLKMVYAASTKGTYALWTELLTAAHSMGLDDALEAELSLGDTSIADRMIAGIPDTPRRARRWVGEMEEIALTFKTLGLTPKILEGAAEMFTLEGNTPLGGLTSRDPLPNLKDMLDVLASQAKRES